MIHFSTEAEKDGMYPVTVFKCPGCSRLRSFYTVFPKECYNCKVKLKNIEPVIENTEARVKFFKGQETK